MQPTAYIKEHTEKYLLSILTGFSLFFVLFVYQGFGIQTGLSFSGHSHFVRAFAFGGLTSYVFYLGEFRLAGFLSQTSLKSKLLWIAVEIFAGANATFLLFNFFRNWTEWYWEGYFLLLFEYACVLIFPISFVWMLERESKRTHLFDHEIMKFTAENGKQTFSIKPENLLYVQSADNYVEIFYLSNNQVKRQLLRTSLKHIETTHASNPYLLRCHRSFMVNPDKISQIIQTGQQLQLDLEQVMIPVSKKYDACFRENDHQVHSSRI